MTARELCEGIKNNDVDAEAALYHLLTEKQGEYLREQCPDDADDLLHELYLQVRTAILNGSIRHPQWVATYAGTVARGLIRRSRGRTRRIIQIDGLAKAA